MNPWWRADVVLRAWRLKSRTDIELFLLPALVRPGSLTLDIGANKGVYTYHLQKLARVAAFEPIPVLARKLAAAMFRNVTVHRCGLGREAATAELSVPFHEKRRGKLNTPGASFRRLDTESRLGAQRFTVDVKRLDDFHFDDVSFIKLDVEGWEENVLAGAEDTFTRNRPALLIEAVERFAPNIFEFLAGFHAQHRYEMFFVAHGERKLRAFSEFDRAHPTAENFLAFPGERAAALVASCNALLQKRPAPSGH